VVLRTDPGWMAGGADGPAMEVVLADVVLQPGEGVLVRLAPQGRAT
jgi:uncharacterized protein YjlB